MLIIIEGPDRTGKSSLARQLYSGAVHYGPPTKLPVLEYSEPIIDYKQSDRPFVADRFHWGEMVYGPKYRERSGLTDGEFEWLELLLQSRGAVTVLCTGNFEAIAERVAADGTDMFDLDENDIADLQWDFATLIRRARTRVFRHNFDMGRPVDVEMVRTFAIQQARNTETLNMMHPKYIGSPNPEVVYVLQDQVYQPAGFQITDDAIALLKATRHLNFRYGIYNPVSNQQLYSLWMRLGGPHLVTVGTTTNDIKGTVHIKETGSVPMIPTLDSIPYSVALTQAVDERFDR